MISHVIRIDQNIIKINYHTDTKKVREDVVHEVLKGNESIGKIKRYDRLFEGSVAGIESSLLFVIFSNVD